MTITQAQTAAREGHELGDLRRRQNEAALAGRETLYRREIEALSIEYAALRDACRFTEAAQVKAQGVALIRVHYGDC